MKALNLIWITILLLSFTNANAQKSDKEIDALWQKCDSLIAKDLPQSALEVIDEIYTLAGKKKLEGEQVKAVIYRITMISDYQEDYYEKSIDEMKLEIDKATPQVKPLLYAMLGELYWNYYSVNRWKFYQRTATDNFENNDIKTWTLDRLVQEVRWCYTKAMEDQEILTNTKIDKFLPLIDDAGFVEYTPTLFDFISWMAIMRFSNEETMLTRPVEIFQVDNEKYFYLGKRFTMYDIPDFDSTSFSYFVIKTFQNLTKAHLSDKNNDVLTYIELQRLAWVRAKSTVLNKDTFYLHSLQELHASNSGNTSWAESGYALASYYSLLAANYNYETAPEYQWYNKKALEIIDEVVKSYPKSRGANNCLVLKENIIRPTMNLTRESASYPGDPFESILNYSNSDTVWFRIIKIDVDKNNDLDRKLYTEELIEYYVKLTPIKEFSNELTNPGDYQTHSKSIIFDGLDEGFYIILHSSTESFDINKGWVGYSEHYSTKITYLSQDKYNEEFSFLILNRKNGEAIPNANVSVYMEKYNYITRSYVYVKYKNIQSDQNGFADLGSLPKNSDYKNMYLDISKGSDRYCTFNTFYMYSRSDYDPGNRTKTIFFTDRSIYRPGQTVYFKGILLNYDKDENYNIIANKESHVYLYDANYQKVADMAVTSNEYGTFTGTFTAPDDGLTGQMHISGTNGTVYFRVEEYKRPKFFVDFEPVEGSYKLNEPITVIGKANAYAGNNIDGAQVKYRVTRTARFPFWFGWWYRAMPYSAAMEITNGTTVTDENGKFKITFDAIPDPSVNKTFLPVFNYTIQADVTDINGETRSSSTWVGAGYRSLILGSNVGTEVIKNNEIRYEISSTNLSGTNVPAEITFLLYELETPEQTYRDRLLSKAEYSSISYEEYKVLFPHDALKDENSPGNWKKKDLVYSHLYKSNIDSIIPLDSLLKGKQGSFLITMSAKDAFGEDVEYQQFFSFIDPEMKSVYGNEIASFHGIETYVEPGNTAKILICSKEKNTKIFYQVEHMGKFVKSEWVELNNGQKLIEFPVEEKHRGNFSIYFAAVKDNRTYLQEFTIIVPYTNKQLDIEFETFRDKLQPGEEETWKIKITNKMGEKEAAELLAGMYDASLDAFGAHSWYMSLLKYNYGYRNWYDHNNFSTSSSSQYSNAYHNNYYLQSIIIPKLDWINYPFYSYTYGWMDGSGYYIDDIVLAGGSSGYGYSTRSGSDRYKFSASKSDGDEESGVMLEADMMMDAPASADATVSYTVNQQTAGEKLAEREQTKDNRNGNDGFGDIEARSNFAETAFFFPQLHTNETGEIIIEFTMPESLTKWKFMGLAHTKDLKTGTITKELQTQKTLMVNSFAPRFFREGDKIVFSSKVSNLSEEDLNGQAQLELIDPFTGESIADKFGLKNPTLDFTVKKGQSTKLSWDLEIPYGVGAVTYRIKAKAGAFTDGEEMSIPILSNRMLVTEAIPLPIRGNETKTWSFDKMVNNTSSTLENFRYTLEFTSNPAWYAIQALPYLMEYPYECNEQTFSRYYANAIASQIANSNPKIKEVFDAWANESPEAFLSNLEKNQELKSLMLEETPWVLEAKDEGERKKRVALLFDIHRMARELKQAEKKLIKAQSPNGGFPWFKGMPDNRYITQHIVTGFGKLDHLGVREIRENSSVWNMISKAVYYLDARISEDLRFIKKYHPDYLTEQHIDYTQAQYLYARSFFPELKIKGGDQEAYDYFFKQAKEYWTSFNIYTRGMISLALFRADEKVVSNDIVKSLRERAILSDEMGMYWREFVGGYSWWEAPIESQAMMIEVFDEVADDGNAVEELRIWLLKQKQVQDWKTTRATSEACYALLIRGTNILASDKIVEVKLGNMVVDPTKIDNCKVEAGTGYFKTSWSGDEIKPEMGKITVTKSDSGIAWGAVYWQYFEDLDKITPAETPLNIKKQLFVERQSPTGPRMEPIGEGAELQVGDKIKVRIEIRVDRDMEYVHMKDMRGSCMEPTNVLSVSKYQGGLWYFENTRDAATNFFFEHLTKGTHVFEYSMFVTHEGDFSNGITTIQCMYAPEFTSHSEGIRVKVKGKSE
ncbi:MAG: hypothetical protein JXR53_01985 [Bacteroidales bacterium]|nr:hypothetical protein [Bacteroidales bacterium]